MNWTDLKDGFCESTVGGPPEPVNAITSLFMTFYGLMGLFITRNHNIVIRLTSAMLAVTGIGSTIYHWTLHTGWGEIDSLPMLMASYLGAYQAHDAIIYKYYALDNANRRLYEKMSGILALIMMGGLAVSLALSVVEDTGVYFPIYFAIPELLIGLAVLLIRFISHKNITETDNKDIYKAFKYMYIGFGTAILAAIFWISTESACKKDGNEWIRFLYAHGVWHFTISMGMYYLMQFLVYIYSFNVGKDPSFVRGSDKWYSKIFYILVPAVELNAPLNNRNINNRNIV